MPKKEFKTWDNLPFKTWPYEEQTEMKHKVFGDYFDKWAQILGKNHPLNYIDGFGGWGAYHTEKGEIYYGSPVIAAEIIDKFNLGDKCSILVIDTEKGNIENLMKIFAYKKIKCKIQFANSDFDKTINELLDKHENIAPTLFLIDPFGFKIKYETLKRIMSKNKSEILMNFMYNAVNRFISLKQNEKIIDELYGTEKWREITSLKEDEREIAIIGLLKTQLKKIASFVFPFRMEFPRMKRTYYYLIHITNHVKGISIMKSCFAKFNHGRTFYLGLRSGQLTLNEIKEFEFKQEEVKAFLKKEYQNKYITYLDILKQNMDKIPYLESDIYHALQKMEEEGVIDIERRPPTTEKGRKRYSIDNYDVIKFKPLK
jgi:three-Cys-motif partner protein